MNENNRHERAPTVEGKVLNSAPHSSDAGEWKSDRQRSDHQNLPAASFGSAGCLLG